MPDRPLLILITTDDPPRKTDPDEVQARKAGAAAEDFCRRLRERGERVTLVPFPASGLEGEAC